MTKAKSVLATAVLILTSAFVHAQKMPDDIACKLIEMGRSVDTAKTAALYAPLQ